MDRSGQVWRGAFFSHGRGRRFNPCGARQPSLASRATARQAIYRSPKTKRAKSCRVEARRAKTGKSRAQSRTLQRQLLSGRTARTRRGERAGPQNEALREERQDLVACRDGRLAGLVDQVGGDDAMGAPNALREEGCHVSICRA